MAEYIDKTKFEELMRKKARSNFDLYYADKSKHYHDCAIGYNMAADEAYDFPAADVQPVRRGRWIKQEGFWNKNTVKCSLCGNYLDMNGVNGGRSDANFCPNCGAKMKED